MTFAYWGTYLGFAVGPERCDHIWSKATDKFALRSNIWKGALQGLHLAAMTYNIFVVAILSYIWQLTLVCMKVLGEEKGTSQSHSRPGQLDSTP